MLHPLSAMFHINLKWGSSELNPCIQPPVDFEGHKIWYWISVLHMSLVYVKGRTETPCLNVPCHWNVWCPNTRVLHVLPVCFNRWSKTSQRNQVCLTMRLNFGTEFSSSLPLVFSKCSALLKYILVNEVRKQQWEENSRDMKTDRRQFAILWGPRDFHPQIREILFPQEVAILQLSIKVVYFCSEHSAPGIHYLQVEET